MHTDLKRHLFPGDGREAIALALCGRHKNDKNDYFLVHDICFIPHEQCSIRESYRVTWPTEALEPLIDNAIKNGFAILKIHSHPTGYNSFSDTDDASDKAVFEYIHACINNDLPQVSAVMLPDGKIFARAITSTLEFIPVQMVSVAGDNLHFWFHERLTSNDEMTKRIRQAFGEGTVDLLKNLKIAIVGCSGTGSPTIEALIRNGVGKVVLVDPDKVEKKNLNRILNTTLSDAIEGRLKVEVLKEAIEQIGFNTEVIVYPVNLFDSKEAIREIASCDIIFGCTDSIDSRHLLNHISTFYLIPYFDMGVKLLSDGQGGIDQITGAVHYIQPGGSSLLSRGVYTLEKLRAANLIRTDPAEYARQRKFGYIVDIEVESPAVISINMHVSSIAVNDFLARIHPYRFMNNSKCACTLMDFSDWNMQTLEDGEPDKYLKKYVGRGYMPRLLNLL
ncbi:ThiF family adenylyltransferase [Rhodocytophaga rosea]|uniref:ThiF family adenylyltransferase n=2 Tax=Rhodocytophaga rosea TaxID=2704465 RepID=A0A6C0GX01_9BACT|nr:ThiF family adenylyltransferase [Rhodocytophaga rosea]